MLDSFGHIFFYKIRRLLIFPAVFAVFFVLLFTKVSFAASETPYDSTSAVIFVYHRIGEDQFPDTNIRIDQFASHIDEIIQGNYNVMPLPDIVNAIKKGEQLPDKTIAITFDGGYKSILENAVPILLKHKIPFTVFFSTDNANWGAGSYMNWKELKKLSSYNGVTLGIHSASYTRFTNSEPETIKAQLNKAKSEFKKHIGSVPEFYAYPFGEYSIAYRDIVEQNGFTSAFGQDSSVAYTDSDLFSLPRFSMTENFAYLDRFKMISNALPLPLSDIIPSDPHITTGIDKISFTLDKSLKDYTSLLSCFSSSQNNPEKTVIGNIRIELSFPAPLQSDRIRINCTMPCYGSDSENRWRWFGMLLNYSENEHNNDIH